MGNLFYTKNGFALIRKLKYNCNNSQKGAQKRRGKIDYEHVLSALRL